MAFDKKRQSAAINIKLYTIIYKCTFNSHICRPQIDTLSNSRFKISVLDSLFSNTCLKSPRSNTHQSPIARVSKKSQLQLLPTIHNNEVKGAFPTFSESLKGVVPKNFSGATQTPMFSSLWPSPNSKPGSTPECMATSRERLTCKRKCNPTFFEILQERMIIKGSLSRL